MGPKSKNHWYSLMGNQEKATVDKQQEIESQSVEKKSKKAPKEIAVTQAPESTSDVVETKATIKIIFEGEAARKILKCEAELKERLSKPDMGKILGSEILTWTDKRWSEIVEENTDIDYFFAQIRKCPDKSKSIKLLKALSEKLKNESSEAPAATATSVGLSVATPAEAQSDVG